MMKVPLFLATTVLLSAIAGCVTIKVDEASAFAPPKRELGPASTQSELDARMAARLQRGVATGGLILSTAPNGEKRISFGPEWGPNITDRSLLAPLTYSNQFVGEGAGRVATTLYSRAATTEISQTQPRPLVVHCAGNAGDRYNSGLNYATKVLPWADVLVFDYPGYGDTPGPASAAAFEAASKTITDHVTAIIGNRKLVFWGHSLGGFVCARLAASVSGADGLILETTAPNAAAVAKAWTPSYARSVVRTSVAPSLASYDVVADAARTTGPVLVLGATKDNVLPVTLARQIFDGLKTRGANVTYQEYPDANHLAVRYQAGFTDTVARFFSAVDAQP
jgi:pimeloyl-ACP methyl ester carboxylesterase